MFKTTKKTRSLVVVLVVSLILSLGGISSNADGLSAVEDISKNEEVQVLAMSSQAKEVKNLKLFAAKKGASFKKDPFDESEELSFLEYGSEVKVVNELPNKWLKVNHKNQSGFIKSSELIDDYTPPHKANTIYFMNKEVPYANTGPNKTQTQIDNHPHTAATFGGATSFSGTDNQNTHFAGHNYSAFNGLWNIKKGETITVTDSNNNAYNYTVDSIKKVTYSGIGYADGVDYWNEITGRGNKERITLQTCINGDPNGVWIISASLSS